jgi:uncharacterized membrane protein
MPFGEFAKQLQALVAGALPFVTSKVQFVLPFLNPQIADDMWPMTSVLAVISSGVTYNLAQRFQKPTVARKLCLWGLGTAVFSFLALMAIVDNIILSESPEWQDFAARVLFVTLFVCVGLVIGWCSSRML